MNPNRNLEKQKCRYDFDSIDEVDEVSGDEQLVSIYCFTHRKMEWRWVPIHYVSGTRH